MTHEIRRGAHVARVIIDTGREGYGNDVPYRGYIDVPLQFTDDGSDDQIYQAAETLACGRMHVKDVFGNPLIAPNGGLDRKIPITDDPRYASVQDVDFGWPK